MNTKSTFLGSWRMCFKPDFKKYFPISLSQILLLVIDPLVTTKKTLAKITFFTFVVGEVSELHGFTDLLVCGTAQLHAHCDRGCDVGVTVGGSLEHYGHLPVYVRLRERAFGLPSLSEEPHLNVIQNEVMLWCEK